MDIYDIICYRESSRAWSLFLILNLEIYSLKLFLLKYKNINYHMAYGNGILDVLVIKIFKSKVKSKAIPKTGLGGL
jgi:hypothetical protein